MYFYFNTACNLVVKGALLKLKIVIVSILSMNGFDFVFTLYFGEGLAVC